jgi:hypothetical protein
MAHFAQLDDNNIVLNVIAVPDDILSYPEDESLGIAYLQDMFGANTNWKQTSYNDNIRNVYAGIGHTYDPTEDKFYPPKPFDYFVWNETYKDWMPPLDYPTDAMINGGEVAYVWDDATYQADNTQGWIIQT